MKRRKISQNKPASRIKRNPILKKSVVFAFVTLFSLTAVFGLSLLTGNNQQSNIGSSSASAQEPADINNDNTVNVFDLSYLLGKWNTADATADLNKDGTVNVFDLSMLLGMWGPVANSPTPSFYGPSFQFDAMGNAQVGGTSAGSDNVFVGFRFKAEQSSQLNSIRAYWLDEKYPGYGGGDGGTYRITVEADNAGMPSGVVLGSVVVPSSVVSSTFPLITLTTPAVLTAGNIYHLVFTNIDANPTVNFSSLDSAWVESSMIPTRQPNRNDTEFYAMVRKFGTTGSWHVEPQYTPIINLTYSNSMHQGQGYMETEFYDPAIISGSNLRVREKITVSGGNRLVKGAAFRLAKTSGTGDLIVRLENASGTVIDTISISTASLPILATNSRSAGVWISGLFASTRTLENGQTYYLTLSTDPATSLWTRGIERGDTFGFASSTYFTDGLIQRTIDGSTWNTLPGLANSGDLQFYLY